MLCIITGRLPKMYKSSYFLSCKFLESFYIQTLKPQNPDIQTQGWPGFYIISVLSFQYL